MARRIDEGDDWYADDPIDEGFSPGPTEAGDTFMELAGSPFSAQSDPFMDPGYVPGSLFPDPQPTPRGTSPEIPRVEIPTRNFMKMPEDVAEESVVEEIAPVGPTVGPTVQEEYQEPYTETPSTPDVPAPVTAAPTPAEAPSVFPGAPAPSPVAPVNFTNQRISLPRRGFNPADTTIDPYMENSSGPESSSLIQAILQLLEAEG